MPYTQERSEEDINKSVHWGQRKLFLAELYFLTSYSDLSSNILYAGASPGNHIPFLTSLFPQHQFHLVDPCPFNVKETSQIRIYNTYCNTQFLQNFLQNISKDVLFISDIRTANPSQHKDLYEHELQIIKDNEFQFSWVQTLKPAKAMLKFRCPYMVESQDGKNKIPSSISILEGIFLLQAWAPKNSTECRLITSGEQRVTINLQEYEEYFAYQNCIKRVDNKFYQNPVNLSDHKQMGKRAADIHNKFDEAHEILVIDKYLTYNNQDEFKIESIKEFSAQITKQLRKSKSNRWLTSPNNYKQFEQFSHDSFRDKEYEIITKKIC